MDEFRDFLDERLEAARGRLDDAFDALSERLGSETRARAAVIGGGAGVVLLLAIFLVAVPATTAPPAAGTDSSQVVTKPKDTRADDGSSTTVDAGSSDEDAYVPDEARTVKELSQKRVVQASVTQMDGPTSMTCQLVNGDSVHVTLIGVKASSTNQIKAGDQLLVFSKEQHPTVWLERDTETEAADGTWPRYLWLADPTGTNVDAQASLWNVAQVGGYFDYAPDDKLTAHETDFKAKVQKLNAAASTEEDEQEADAARKEEYRKRKEAQERKEREESGSATNDSSTSSDPATSGTDATTK